MLDVRRLRLLRELHARGTVAAVAEALSYTPSAVSQQLALLEREAGVPLLERVGRNVRLTDAARVLVGHAEAVLARLEQAEADLEAAGATVRGEVRVSAFQTAARGLVAPAIIALAHEHPQLVCGLLEMEAEEAFSLLRTGDADVVVAEEYAESPRPVDRAFERCTICEDPMFLVLPTGHPHADSDAPLPLAALEGEPWATSREGTLFAELTRRACRTHGGYEPEIRHRANDVQLLVHLARRGLAVTLVPGLGGRSHEGVVLRPVAGADLTRTIFAASRRGSGARPAVAAVLSALRTAAAELGLPVPG